MKPALQRIEVGSLERTGDAAFPFRLTGYIRMTRQALADKHVVLVGREANHMKISAIRSVATIAFLREVERRISPLAPAMAPETRLVTPAQMLEFAR